MVTTKRSLVLATCFLSGAASIFSFVSLFTEQWVLSDGRLVTQPDGKDSDFNYGLFGGTYSSRYGYSVAADITMTCSYSNNVCALLCGKNSDRLSEILDKLYNGISFEWNVNECPHTRPLTYLLERGRGVISKSEILKLEDGERKFINAYAHLFTIIFLGISALIGLLSAGLSVWNTASNPIEIYFNIFGLYIYNSIAFFSTLISVCIWGIMFCSTLVDNPSFLLTLSGKMKPTSVGLGWSYWINMVSLLLYATSVTMLYLRSYLISKEPQHKVEIEENTSAGILLF